MAPDPCRVAEAVGFCLRAAARRPVFISTFLPPNRKDTNLWLVSFCLGKPASFDRLDAGANWEKGKARSANWLQALA